jgi:hypothetical protein
MTLVRALLPAALLLAACAAPRDGSEDSWGNRFADLVDPVVPDSLQNRGPALQAELRSDPAEFPLAERREVRIFFTVKNVSKRAERLDFATTQRFDLSVIAPDGKRIFLWSEDRAFEPVAASVMVNPQERVEYEAVVPTRDMKGGGIYRIEAGLTGFAEIAATSQLRPQ